MYLFKISICCFLTRGINPINAYSSVSRGIWLKKVVTAQAPGIDVILILLSSSSFINTEPGSEIPGVPASETRATDFPSLI